MTSAGVEGHLKRLPNALSKTLLSRYLQGHELLLGGEAAAEAWFRSACRQDEAAVREGQSHARYEQTRRRRRLH